MTTDSSARQLAAAKRLIGDLADKLDLDAHVRLWDGSRTPLGRNATGPFELSIAGPGVIGSMLRRPTLDTLIRHYIDKRLDFSGGTLIDFAAGLNRNGRSVKVKGLEALKIAGRLAPFLFAPTDAVRDEHGFAGEITGKRRRTSDNKDFIQFHYDLSNDFYALFLDPEMVYSCAYFTDWENDIATAQADKLEMICRKLRLKPGDRLLDIGSGWGGLVCHAAKAYGVKAHGITLSEEQLAFAREKVKRLGLEGQVTVRAHRLLAGRRPLRQDRLDRHVRAHRAEEHPGVHEQGAVASRGRRTVPQPRHRAARAKPSPFGRRLRPEQKAIAKYIFPGGELDDIGHTLVAMERAGFEVQDVEAWRLHYARTCRLWCERLTARRDEAIAHIGEEKYRIWVVYLAGVSIAFSRGTLRLFQTLVSKSAKRPPALPPTRADLYR